MTRSELEHVIRASGAIAGDNELIIIGSQSILAQFPDAPATLRVSMETDLYPRNKPELADLVDGSIGEGSGFHEQFRYHVQGVGPDTARLPAGWEKRLVRIENENTCGVAGLAVAAGAVRHRRLAHRGGRRHYRLRAAPLLGALCLYRPPRRDPRRRWPGAGARRAASHRRASTAHAGAHPDRSGALRRALPPERRPIDLHAALAEVAR